jgi:hypothetical protein
MIYFVHHFKNYEALTVTEDPLTILISKLLKVSAEGETEKVKQGNNHSNAKYVSCAYSFSAVHTKVVKFQSVLVRCIAIKTVYSFRGCVCILLFRVEQFLCLSLPPLIWDSLTCTYRNSLVFSTFSCITPKSPSVIILIIQSYLKSLGMINNILWVSYECKTLEQYVYKL